MLARILLYFGIRRLWAKAALEKSLASQLSTVSASVFTINTLGKGCKGSGHFDNTGSPFTEVMTTIEQDYQERDKIS